MVKIRLRRMGAKKNPEETRHPEETHHPEETRHPEETHHPEETRHPEETHHPEETRHPEETHHPEESHGPESTTEPGADSSSSPTVPGGGIVIPGLGGGSADPSPSPSQSTGGDHLEPTGPTDSDEDLEAFLGSLFDSYDFPGMDVLATDFIANWYSGLTAIPAVQRVVCTTAIGFNTAEIALVQVTNSSDVSAVKSILQARIDSQVAGGAFYPAAVEQWEKNNRIVEHGNYIMMVVHSNCDDIVADFNALF